MVQLITAVPLLDTRSLEDIRRHKCFGCGTNNGATDTVGDTTLVQYVVIVTDMLVQWVTARALCLMLNKWPDSQCFDGKFWCDNLSFCSKQMAGRNKLMK